MTGTTSSPRRCASVSISIEIDAGRNDCFRIYRGLLVRWRFRYRGFPRGGTLQETRELLSAAAQHGEVMWVCLFTTSGDALFLPHCCSRSREFRSTSRQLRDGCGSLHRAKDRLLGQPTAHGFLMLGQGTAEFDSCSHPALRLVGTDPNTGAHNSGKRPLSKKVPMRLESMLLLRKTSSRKKMS